MLENTRSVTLLKSQRHVHTVSDTVRLLSELMADSSIFFVSIVDVRGKSTTVRFNRCLATASDVLNSLGSSSTSPAVLKG